MPTKRRDSGDGSIYKRGDGRWVASLDLGRDPSGKRRRKVVYGETKTEAKTKLAAVREQWRRTGTLAPVHLTLRAWCDEWLRRRERDQDVNPLTLDGYRQKLARVCDIEGARRMDRLTAEHVRRVYAELATEGRAQSYIRQTHRILSHAMRDAWAERMVMGDNPMRLVKTPKVGQPAKVTHPMSPDEFVALLAQLPGDRLGSRYLVQPTLGMRQGEVCGLAWEDVDLDVGVIHIRRTLQRHKGKGLQFRPPKSATSTRPIPLPPLAWEALRIRHAEWLTEPHPHLDPKKYGPLTPVALVWPHASGMPREPRRDATDWAALLNRAGLDHMGTHSLRHGLATRLSEIGQPVKVAQAILGHADPALTMRVYTHTDDSATRLALEAAERAWRGQTAISSARP